ncbi:MAG: hypothetical protein IH840_02780 [Candidatus Heimdallarchaeota archaeon]|nr:hypothetical protein [Candidatus Heimdallarchaeota archaeon]
MEDVEAGEDRIIVIQITKAKLFSKKVKAELVCLSSEEGSILYKYPLFDQEVTGIPSAFLIDKDKNVVTGGMYFNGEKWSNTNSDGIFFLKA